MSFVSASANAAFIKTERLEMGCPCEGNGARSVESLREDLKAWLDSNEETISDKEENLVSKPNPSGH